MKAARRFSGMNCKKKSKKLVFSLILLKIYLVYWLGEKARVFEYQQKNFLLKPNVF